MPNITCKGDKEMNIRSKGSWITSIILVLVMMCFVALSMSEEIASSTTGWQQTSSMISDRQAFGFIVGNGHAYALGGAGYYDFKSEIEMATVNSDQSLSGWTTIGNLPTGMGRIGTLIIGDYLYVFGGSLSNGDSASVYKALINQDGTLGSWMLEANSMNYARADSGVTYFNGFIYVIGGCANGNRLNKVEYAPVNSDGSIGTWTLASDMAYARWKTSAVAANGYLYAIGGLGNAYVSYIERAQIMNDGSIGSWSIVGNPFDNPDAMIALEKDGYIYVIGGSTGGGNGTAIVQKALINSDGTLGSWIYTDNMNTGRKWHGAYATESAIYACGGYIQAIGAFHTSCEYLVEESVQTTENVTWTITSALNQGRQAFSAVAAKGYVYAFGGYSNSGFMSSIERSPVQVDGSLGAWENYGSLNSNLAHSGAIVIGDYVYLVGGQPYDYGDLRTIYKAKINTDGSLGNWATESNQLNTARTDMGLVHINGYLYAIGGASNGGRLKTVEYAKVNSDGSLGSWQYSNSMNIERWKTSAVACNGYLYAIGGLSSYSGYVASIEKAQINSDGTLGSWSYTGDSIINPDAMDVKTIGNKLYVVGGAANGGNGTSIVQSAQINSDGTLGTWAQDTKLSIGRKWFSLAEYNGVLYSVGGLSGSVPITSAEYYVVSLSTSTTIENEAPAAPTGLGATAGNMQIVLSWDANSDSDLAGYNLYRRQNAGDYAKLNSSLLTQTSYTDNGLTNGETYYYVVKAVDSEGLESEASNEVHAIPTGSWIQTAKEYWVPIYGWFNSMVCLSNVSNDTLDYVMTLYSNMGVQVSEISGKLNPHVSWSSLPELGNLYNLSNPVVCKVVASGEIRMATSLWGKSSDSVWEYDVDEVGQAGMYDYWILAAKYNQSIINVANPNDIEANITFKAYNNDGTVIKTKEITIPAHGMVADLEMRNTLTAQANAVRIQSDIPVVTSAGSFTSDGNNGQGLGVSPRSRNLKNR